ncbi:MAG: O-antigen ligase family protein [Chloroflexota bacterium]
MTSPDVSAAQGAARPETTGLAFDGRFRVAFVLFGGMVALQSSPVLDATKIAYLVGTVVCLAGAMVAVWTVRRTAVVRLSTPWLAASAALAGLCGLSLAVALGNGVSIADWVRDVAAYALFAAVPVFALDAQASTTRKLLVGMLVLAGMLGGLAWSVEWLNRRHILDLPFDRLVFPSPQLPGMLYIFALATALTSARRATAWAFLAGLILGLFLLTGTRSSLLLLIGPLAMAVLAGRARIRSSVRAILSHGFVAAALVLSFQIGVLGLGPAAPDAGSPEPAATPGPNVLGDRFGTLPELVNDPGADPSITERVAQYEAAWALFVSSPIVGVGPGHSIDWVDVSGYPRTGFTADTPLVMPAKFGLLGILVILGAAVAYAATARTALRRDSRSVTTLALVGYGAWTILGLPLGFPIEDKGASLALMLLLGLAFAESNEPDSIVGQQRS